jgi:hypothetical protein
MVSLQYLIFFAIVFVRGNIFRKAYITIYKGIVCERIFHQQPDFLIYLREMFYTELATLTIPVGILRG